MGKTIVRRHLTNTDTQSVWRELSEHMRTSSKGASEKRRLTQYVTNTVLDDNFKGTTEQLVLHFNEQFRQLDEITEDSEKLAPTVKLTLLQTAVRSINDLRIVETLDEFQSTSYGHGSTTSLSYQTYYDLLINACVRYDKTKKANIGKRRNVYNTNIDVKDTPNLDTLVFCFSSLTTVEAPDLFVVDTNLTLFYICFYFCCNIAYPNLHFLNCVLSYFLFVFLLSLMINILILWLSIIYCSCSFILLHILIHKCI